MKNSLMLMPVFFLALLISLVACPFLYSLSRPEAFAAIAAGDVGAFFSRNLQNALEFVPTGLLLSFSAVFVYIARRRIEGIGSLLFVLALLVLSIALIEPVAAKLSLSLHPREADRPASASQSGARAGFIEEREPSLKTVALEGSAGLARPVLIAANTSGMSGGRGLNVYSGGNAASLRFGNRASPLDLQVAQRLEEPAFLRRLSQDIGAANAILFDAACSSIGGYAWTSIAFFSLAASFFFLCLLTDWKLINFTLYAIALRGLYRLFPMLHDDAALGFLGRFLPSFLPDAALASLPLLLATALLVVLGFALILPRYIRRNQGDLFL